MPGSCRGPLQLALLESGEALSEEPGINAVAFSPPFKDWRSAGAPRASEVESPMPAAPDTPSQYPQGAGIELGCPTRLLERHF